MYNGKLKIKSAKELKQEINAVTTPIIARHEHYMAAKTKMLQSISKHFFAEQHQSKIAEVTRKFAGDSAVPVNAQLLEINFESYSQFSDIIEQSGLGLVMDGDFFILADQDGLQPETVLLMQQLAYALSAYRVCFGMEQIYQCMLQDHHVQTQDFEQYLPQIQELTVEYEEGLSSAQDLKAYLRNYYFKALAIQNQIALQHNQIHVWKESFAESMKMGLSVICDGIKTTGQRLINAIKEFPDKTWLGDGWSLLVINLVNQLVAGYYSYSFWIAGAVTINTNYFVLLSTELAKFSLTMQDQMEELKLAFLSEATIELNNLIQTIHRKAVANQIILVEEVQQPYPYSQSPYGLLYKSLKNIGEIQSRNVQEFDPPANQF